MIAARHRRDRAAQSFHVVGEDRSDHDVERNDRDGAGSAMRSTEVDAADESYTSRLGS